MPPLSGFVNGAYQNQSLVVAGEDCVNLLPEIVAQGGKARSALVPAPGVTEFAALPQAPGRGIFEHKGRCFTVYGTKVYELDAVGVATERGTVPADANPATFDTNGDGGNELMVTSGDTGNILDLGTNVFSTPLASGSTQCGQLDGFLLSFNAATSTFRSSDSLDGLTWSGINVAQRTSASDPWKAMIVANNDIHLIGGKTGESWYNAGLPTFPFAQRPEGFYEAGILAPFSLSRAFGSIAWLGITERGGAGVYLLDGYAPRKVSNEAVDWTIEQYNAAAGLTDAVGWSYDREGHSFYVLGFPRAGKCLTYDFTTDKWHRRAYWDQMAAQFTMYRPVFHCFCFGKNLVCDSNSNKVYALSSLIYTDVGGAELRRVRRTPHMSAENKRLVFTDVELECDRGVGNANAPGDNPLVALRYSNDGGVTFGQNRTREIGRTGAYTTRARWENCGSGRDRVWELWQSDPVPSRWFDLYVNGYPLLN